MKHELKITMEFEDKQPIPISNVKVYIDDEQIGGLQKIIFRAETDRLFADLDIEGVELSESSLQLSPQLAHLGKDLDLLKSVPMVNITMKEI